MERILTSLINLLPSAVSNKLQNADNELLSGSVLFFITKLFGIVFTYFFAWWVARNFGAAKWGFITLMITTINVISIFCLLGLDMLMIKYVSEFQSQKDMERLRGFYLRSSQFVLFCSIIICLVFLAAPSFFSGLLFGKPFISPWLMVTALGIPANVAFQLNNAALSGLKDMLSYGFFKNVALFGASMIFYWILDATLFPIYLPRFGDSGILVLVTYVAVTYLALMFNTFQLNKKIHFTSRKRIVPFSNKEMFKQSYPLLLTASLSVIVTTTDYFMLSHFKTPLEVGLYDIAYKVSILTLIFLLAVNAIATPKFSELYKNNDYKGLRKIVRQSSKMIFYSSVPIVTILVLFPKQILSLFKDEFVAASSALIILACGQFINAISGSVGNLLKMTNHQLDFQYIALGSTILNIGLNFYLIPKYSINGAAFSSALCLSLANIAAMTMAYKRLGIVTLYFPGLSK